MALAWPRGLSPTRLYSSTGQTPQVYFGGLPRFAKINPRASAAHRSRLANLSASLRSGPGGIRRASSKASTARVPQSYLPVERRVSLSIAPQSSCQLDSFRTFDGKTPIWIMFIPGSDCSTARVIIPSPVADHQSPSCCFNRSFCRSGSTSTRGTEMGDRQPLLPRLAWVRRRSRAPHVGVIQIPKLAHYFDHREERRYRSK
jgi:hypothetical protein